MTPFERSVAFWLRAYPRRWRAVRSAEVSAVLEDLAEPGARRIGPVAAFELVRGGWATRWRGHPPLHVYLAYRLFNRRIPVQWRDWARDDIEGLLFPVRGGLGAAWVVWGLGSFTYPPWFICAGTLLMVTVGVVSRSSMRANLARRHLALRPGERVVAGALVEGLARRRRLEARSALRAAEVALALAVAVGVAAAWVRPPLLVQVSCGADEVALGCATVERAAIGTVRPLVLAAMALAAVLGLVLVPLVRSQMRRLIGDRPVQPHRDLVTTSRGDAVVLVAATSLAVALVLGIFGSRTFVLRAGDMLTGVLGPLALLALPAVVAAARAVRRAATAGEGLSVSDLRTMVLRGRAPRVDPPRRGLVRIDGPHVASAATLGTSPVLRGVDPGDAVPLDELSVVAEPPDDASGYGYLDQALRPRRRTESRSALAAVLAMTVVAAVASASAVLLGPTLLHLTSCAVVTEAGAARCSGPVGRPADGARVVLVLALVLALAVGLALARVVRRRLRGLAPSAPPQPSRTTVGRTPGLTAAVLAWCAAVVIGSALEATGRWPVAATAVLGPCALLALPGVLTAWRFVRSTPAADRLAGVDVLTIAAFGRVPVVDRSRIDLVPRADTARGAASVSRGEGPGRRTTLLYLPATGPELTPGAHESPSPGAAR